MSGRDYPRLSIEDFGEALLETGDLDPIYIALSRMDWDEVQRNRWLLVYWLCYHAGVACWLSEQSGTAFWTQLEWAALNGERHTPPVGGRWPRAPERRHWRGKAAISSVDFLKRRYGQQPEDMVEYCAGAVCDSIPYSAVKTRVVEHYGFGDWIAFKVADMLERCCDVPVVFTRSDAMYDSPRQAALALARSRTGLPDTAKFRDPNAAINAVLDHLQARFGEIAAPPGGGRLVGYQELETILCKWQSHMNGHYPLDNDIVEIRAGLEPWSRVSPTARAFLHNMPRPTVDDQRATVAATSMAALGSTSPRNGAPA